MSKTDTTGWKISGIMETAGATIVFPEQVATHPAERDAMIQAIEALGMTVTVTPVAA